MAEGEKKEYNLILKYLGGKKAPRHGHKKAGRQTAQTKCSLQDKLKY